MSADIVGSTSLKQTRGKHFDSVTESKKGPAWFSAIQGFYFEAAQAFLNEWSSQKAISAAPAALYGEEPAFWKSIGDEVLFTKILTDHRQLATTLACWFIAVRRMRVFLRNENPSLDVKCTAWLAGFPYRNREVVIGLAAPEASRMVEDYYKESGRLLNEYYKNSRTAGVSVDYIGPSIDTGFRLTSFSSSRKMVLSLDAAYLLSMTSFDGEVKRIDLHYDGSHDLKGVMGGSPYPVFWINMSSENSLAVKEDLLKSQTICNKENVKEFCDSFYLEYELFTFRPFISGDIGQALAKRPEGYDDYHAALVKNFNLPDDEYALDPMPDEVEAESVDQKQIEEFVDAIEIRNDRFVSNPFAAGDFVIHKKFGHGTVIGVEGNKVTVQFELVGERRVLSDFLVMGF